MSNPLRHELVQSSSPPRLIMLTIMPQLVEARGTDDNWTGLANTATRRRGQVKLNTRAYRRRKALQAALSTTGTSAPRNAGDVACWNEQQQAIFFLPASQARALGSELKSQLNEDHLPSRLIFPISSDHLITLIQINVLRACHTNSNLLGELIPKTYDCTNGALHIVPPDRNGKELPHTLEPTWMQSQIPHEPWVDIFPHPGWRDNFLRALGSFDEDELCNDMVGGLFQSEARDLEQHGTVVWSPPWHYDGWELSEGFFRKWGWSIKGCKEVLEATNRWRASRGEEPLQLDYY